MTLFLSMRVELHCREQGDWSAGLKTFENAKFAAFKDLLGPKVVMRLQLFYQKIYARNLWSLKGLQKVTQ